MKIVRYVNLYFSSWRVKTWYGYHFKSCFIILLKVLRIKPVPLRLQLTYNLITSICFFGPVCSPPTPVLLLFLYWYFSGVTGQNMGRCVSRLFGTYIGANWEKISITFLTITIVVITRHTFSLWNLKPSSHSYLKVWLIFSPVFISFFRRS